MRKLMLYCLLVGCFGIALAVESLLTQKPPVLPGHRAVVILGGTSVQEIPSHPPLNSNESLEREAFDPRVQPETEFLDAESVWGSSAAPRLRAARPLAETAVTQSNNASSSTSHYVVKEGDSLWSISERFFGSNEQWVALAELNGIGSRDPLTVGMTLKIPDSVKTDSAEENSAYRVQPGETLSAIALAELGDAQRWREILQLNGLVNPDQVQAGSMLKLPKR